MNISMDEHGGLSRRLEGAVDDLEEELGHPVTR